MSKNETVLNVKVQKNGEIPCLLILIFCIKLRNDTRVLVIFVQCKYNLCLMNHFANANHWKQEDCMYLSMSNNTHSYLMHSSVCIHLA
jgi:hypothetical protein